MHNQPIAYVAQGRALQTKGMECDTFTINIKVHNMAFLGMPPWLSYRNMG